MSYSCASPSTALIARVSHRWQNYPVTWTSVVKHFCPSVPIILVGNKKDLNDDEHRRRELLKMKQEPVKPEDGRVIAKQISAFEYMECSAKTKDGDSPENSDEVNVKRPKRGEVAYCPSYPAGENPETLEKLGVELLADVNKRNNRETVRAKMDRTYALRRYEVNAEFKRITTVMLQSKFLSQLDMHSANLIKLFKKCGGEPGIKLKEMMPSMVQDDIDGTREFVIRGLGVYLNEDPENLVQQYVSMDRTRSALEKTTMGIFIVKDSTRAISEDVGVIIEGVIVLQDLDNVAFVVTMLFGLINALNLTYPRKLCYTFEVLQKVILELEGSELSHKAQNLKTKLQE
uniref:Uncharacterized protein n=1 Tax=Paramormyrops kingsleyae TaxID=1676925 RepID=A0A3B3SWQ9_9TELE